MINSSSSTVTGSSSSHSHLCMQWHEANNSARASDEQSHIRYEQIPHNQHLILWRKNMYNMQTWTIEIQVFPLLHLNVMSLLVLFVIKAEACVCDCEVVLFSVFVRVQLWRHHWRSEERLWEGHWDHCCGLQQQVRPAALLSHRIPAHILFIN